MHSELTLSQIFRKKIFGSKKIFGTPLSEKIGKKPSKMAKMTFFSVKGELTCELQVKTTLFYLKKGEFCDDIAILVTKNNIFV